MPSAAAEQPLRVSALDELVSPTSTFGAMRWRFISFNMPQVVKGWEEMIIMSAPDFLKARACTEKFVSAISQLDDFDTSSTFSMPSLTLPVTPSMPPPTHSKPCFLAMGTMTIAKVSREWAWSVSVPP